MDKQHFEHLIKGVRGSRTKELTGSEIGAILETAKSSSNTVREADWCECAYVAKLGAKSDTSGVTGLY